MPWAAWAMWQYSYLDDVAAAALSASDFGSRLSSRAGPAAARGCGGR